MTSPVEFEVCKFQKQRGFKLASEGFSFTALY